MHRSAVGASIGSLALVLALAATASAQVLQPTPGGVQVPAIDGSVTVCRDKNVELCIDEAEGDPTLIDTRADALIAPETFQPTCQLTFKPIVKGGSIYDVFGWYNVKENPISPGKFLKPTQAELYGMFATNDFKSSADFASTEVVLDLGVEAAAGRYKGGQIGFFLASTSEPLSIDPVTHEVKGTIRFQFHTQHELNVGSTTTQTFYNVLTWESVAQKNTFYFGWEDLPADQGGDNDFDDFVFSVSGVQCGGGGQPCETGKDGVCAAGILQCKKSVITCVQTIPEGSESCNALDDDCNGQVDDGELCAGGEVCARGRCVPNCGTGEFRCPPGTACTSGGVCVDELCKDVACDTGLVCSGGECVDSCTGIECPTERVCRNGACIDPCVGIECDAGFSCQLGICTSCECSACGSGLVCQGSQCIESECANQTCDKGTHCSAGACVDNCDGAVCPEGQLCTAGECVADPAYSGGGTGGATATGGLGPLTPGGGTNGGGGSGSGSGGKRGSPKLVPSEPACSCSLPASAGDRSAALLLVALGTLVRRRRAARRSAD